MVGVGVGGEKKRRSFIRLGGGGGGGQLWRKRWREEMRRTEKMTGSGAVIHFLSARTAAEHRSNPLV